MTLLSISIEVLFRISWFQSPLLSNVTSAVNWSCVVLMTILTILVRKYYHPAKFVCPLITVFCFYYYAVVDFQGIVLPIYNVIVVGTTITYLLLTYFIEDWIIQSLISIPIFSVLTWRQSKAVLQE